MTGPIRVPGDRVSLVLPAEASVALDELARFHWRDRRSEAMRLLLDAIGEADRLRRLATAPVDPSLPRSVEARRRAADTRVRRAQGRAR